MRKRQVILCRTQAEAENLLEEIKPSVPCQTHIAGEDEACGAIRPGP